MDFPNDIERVLIPGSFSDALNAICYLRAVGRGIIADGPTQMLPRACSQWSEYSRKLYLVINESFSSGRLQGCLDFEDAQALCHALGSQSRRYECLTAFHSLSNVLTLQS